MIKMLWSLVGVVCLAFCGCASAPVERTDSFTWNPQVEAGETLESFGALDAMLDSAINCRLHSWRGGFDCSRG